MYFQFTYAYFGTETIWFLCHCREHIKTKISRCVRRMHPPLAEALDSFFHLSCQCGVYKKYFVVILSIFLFVSHEIALLKPFSSVTQRSSSDFLFCSNKCELQKSIRFTHMNSIYDYYLIFWFSSLSLQEVCFVFFFELFLAVWNCQLDRLGPFRPYHTHTKVLPKQKRKNAY